MRARSAFVNAFRFSLYARAGIKMIEHITTHAEPPFNAIVDGDHEGIVAMRWIRPRAGRHEVAKIKSRLLATRSG